MFKLHYLALSALLAATLVTQSPTAAAATQAALNGASSGVVNSASDGSTGPVTSYIRLFNGNAAASTFTVTVIGSQSGQTYGQATSIQIPANASLQYSLVQILALAGAKAGAGGGNGDTSYSLYIQDTDAASGYQHIIYDSTNQFFENASICNNGLLAAATVAANDNVAVPNVHTSMIGEFPSLLSLHNYGTASATYKITIIDAGSFASDGKTINSGAGTTIGTTTLTIPANTTAYKLFTDLQTAVNWQPNSTQSYANVLVSDSSGVAPTVIVGHTVHTGAPGGDLNLTTACAANKTAGSAVSTTKYQGTIAGLGMQSGTLTTNFQSSALASASSTVATQSSIEKTRSVVERLQSLSPTSATLLLSDGSKVTLTGTLDTSTNAVSLSGSGYTFSGTASNGIYSGTYTGPNTGAGAFSTLSAAQGAVTAYCGSYTENNGSATGVINLQISATGVASGDTAPTSGDTEPGTFTGQASGSSITVVHHSADGNPANDTTVTATVQNGAISGSFPTGRGGTGTFSASTCALP